MVGRDVEQLEVVGVGLDLGALEHLEPEGVQDLAHVPHEREGRMQVTHRHRTAGRRHVDGVGCQRRLEVIAAQRLQPLPDRRLQLATQLVRAPADRRALVGRNGSQPAQERRQPAGPAEQLVAKSVDLIRVDGGLERPARVGADTLELVGKLAHRFVIHHR
jgi:hypothetical protein